MKTEAATDKIRNTGLPELPAGKKETVRHTFCTVTVGEALKLFRELPDGVILEVMIHEE